MNATLSRLLSALGGQLPALATLIPGGAAVKLGVGVIAAIGQKMLDDSNATPEEITAKVEEDPAKAVKVLQPLEDHATAVATAAVAAVTTVPTAMLPAATAAMEDSVTFVTDDRPFMLSEPDSAGGAVLSQYMDAKELNSLRTAMRPTA